MMLSRESSIYSEFEWDRSRSQSRGGSRQKPKRNVDSAAMSARAKSQYRLANGRFAKRPTEDSKIRSMSEVRSSSRSRPKSLSPPNVRPRSQSRGVSRRKAPKRNVDVEAMSARAKSQYRLANGRFAKRQVPNNGVYAEPAKEVRKEESAYSLRSPYVHHRSQSSGSSRQNPTKSKRNVDVEAMRAKAKGQYRLANGRFAKRPVKDSMSPSSYISNTTSKLVHDSAMKRKQMEHVQSLTTPQLIRTKSVNARKRPAFNPEDELMLTSTSSAEPVMPTSILRDPKNKRPRSNDESRKVKFAEMKEVIKIPNDHDNRELHQNETSFTEFGALNDSSTEELRGEDVNDSQVEEVAEAQQIVEIIKEMRLKRNLRMTPERKKRAERMSRLSAKN